MENPFSKTDSGLYLPKMGNFDRNTDAIRVAMWDLYGVIHPDKEALDRLKIDFLEPSPTVKTQTQLLSALLGDKDPEIIEQEIFGPSSGENLSAALEQLDYGNISPEEFMVSYFINHGIAPKKAEYEGNKFIYDYVQAIANSIDRRITDILIPELRLQGVYSQVVTDRTVLALAVARKVPDYLNSEHFPLGIISSQQVKLHKPDPEIYRKALDFASFRLHSKIQPNTAVMIDDRDYNLIGSEKDNFTQGAVNIGMYGIEYSTYEKLVEGFYDLGIKTGLKKEV